MQPQPLILTHRTGALTFATTTGEEVSGFDEFWANIVESYLDDGDQALVWSIGAVTTVAFCPRGNR